MRIALLLAIVTAAVGSFMLASGRPRAHAASRPPIPRRPRRIHPELTAAAAAERWYDEA